MPGISFDLNRRLREVLAYCSALDQSTSQKHSLLCNSRQRPHRSLLLPGKRKGREYPRPLVCLSLSLAP